MMVVQPDSSCDVNSGYEKKAIDDWNRTVSRLHWNSDFQLNSQSLAMCLTPVSCLGGRAWPNVIVNDSEHEIVLLLWSNSTLGLLMHWWRGTRQQQGRSIIPITAIPDHPVVDPRALSSKQINQCHLFFHEFEDKSFLPANEAYRDDVRKELEPCIAVCCTRFSSECNGLAGSDARSVVCRTISAWREINSHRCCKLVHKDVRQCECRSKFGNRISFLAKSMSVELILPPTKML